ncbi:hypothetical protein ACOME3_006373 [Neoechinorhynchus agilis]
MENPMESKRKKSSAMFSHASVGYSHWIDITCSGSNHSGCRYWHLEIGEIVLTMDSDVLRKSAETRGGAVLNARILSGDARVGNAINGRILQDDINARLIRGLRQLGRFPFFLRVLEVPPLQSIRGRMLNVTMNFIVYFQRRCSDNCTIGRQTLLANAFKNLTINIGTGIVVVENATVNLDAETESSAGTLANITAERNQLPLSTSLLPLVADWKQVTITLGNNVGSLAPAVVGNQVNQIIHDLNAYVSGETISNQSVIFINFIGTAPTINTANGATTLTIKLRTLHYRGCLNCNSTLLAALRHLLSILRISAQPAANYQPKLLMNVAGMNFVLENTTELTVQEAQTMLEAKSLLVRTQIPLTLTITCRDAANNNNANCPRVAPLPTPADVQNSIIQILRGINKTNTQNEPYAVGNVAYVAPNPAA